MPSLKRRKRSRSSSGSPMSRRNTVHGSGTATSALNSHRPVSTKRVDQVVHQAAHRALELADLARREQRVEQPAELHVLGRIDLQRDQRPDVADVDRAARREDLGVAQRRHHVLVARDERHVHVGRGHDAHLAHHRVELLRVRRGRLVDLVPAHGRQAVRLAHVRPPPRIRAEAAAYGPPAARCRRPGPGRYPAARPGRGGTMRRRWHGSTGGRRDRVLAAGTAGRGGRSPSDRPAAATPTVTVTPNADLGLPRLRHGHRSNLPPDARR